MKITKRFLPYVITSILIAACVARTPSSKPPAVSVPGPQTVSTSIPDGNVPPANVPNAAPAQAEGQDPSSDFTGPVTANGQLLVLYGRLMDASGKPLADHAVEIWQVDANGIYDHPDDPNTASRDMGFQFYGTAVTQESGLFTFRTILPGFYEPRPRHIHFKVKKDGNTLLTSQFYFAEEVTAEQLGAGGELLLLDLSDGQDGAGNAIKLAFKTIVVDTGSVGDLALTPSQAEGPYYPVVDVSRYDHDLASLP